jgi:excinuclease ABC subunit C
VRQDTRSRYFGPFPYSSLLRRTLAHLRREFGILLSDSTPQELPDGRWRLYDDVRQEIYGHANEVTPEEYRERVDQACAFLNGKSREWLEDLQAEMQAAAADQKFEKAAELRDAVFALQKTLEKARRFERDHPTIRPDADALGSLRETLALSAPPAHMECFDISHISGTFVVASMVHFTDGRPDKARYRRFKIKSFIGNDDFRAMEEVVGRRYRRLRDEGRNLPNLIVIDGGQGQVGAAIKAFLQLDLEPPALIGLAKKHETIIFADEREPLNLSINDPGLQLLQRLRDEAHRFANTYNADLRSKRIRESLLEDMPGLGPSRQRALLDHFGSLERLRAASISELTDVPGIGPKFAVALKDFLTRHGKESVESTES